MPEPAGIDPGAARAVDRSAPTPPGRVWDASWVRRLVIAHAAAYPVAFAWVAATLPQAFLGMPPEVLDEDRAAALHVGLRALLAFAVAYLLAHAVALPWMLRATRGTRRAYAIALAVLGTAAVAVASIAWPALLRRPG